MRWRGVWEYFNANLLFDTLDAETNIRVRLEEDLFNEIRRIEANERRFGGEDEMKRVYSGGGEEVRKTG